MLSALDHEMIACRVHTDLEYIYVFLDPLHTQLLKCPQCIIDEEISNTKQLIMLNSILKQNDQTMLLNWPLLNSPQTIKAVSAFANKNKNDESLQYLKKKISAEISSLSDDLMKLLKEEERKLHSIIDQSIIRLGEFKEQYQIYSEKDHFRDFLLNYNVNVNSNEQKLNEFIKSKFQQSRVITEGLLKVCPQMLIDFDEIKMSSVFAEQKKQLQISINALSQKIFKQEIMPKEEEEVVVQSQNNQKVNQSKHKQQCINAALRKDNNSTSTELDSILSIFNQRSKAQVINLSEQIQQAKFQQDLQTVTSQDTQNSFTSSNQPNSPNQIVPNVVFDRLKSSDGTTAIENESQSFMPAQIKSSGLAEDDQNQSDSNLRESEIFNLNETLQLTKSFKGGANTDLVVGRDNSGCLFVKYHLSGYDHSQCYLDTILNPNKHYTIRVDIRLRNPKEDKIIIGLIRKSKVDQMYVHQEKVCFGNSSFSTTSKVIQGELISSEAVWVSIKQIEFSIHIKSGLFSVADYPKCKHKNSLQNPHFLSGQSNEANEWVFGLFFFSDIEQINNCMKITYFDEK